MNKEDSAKLRRINIMEVLNKTNEEIVKKKLDFILQDMERTKYNFEIHKRLAEAYSKFLYMEYDTERFTEYDIIYIETTRSFFVKENTDRNTIAKIDYIVSTKDVINFTIAPVKTINDDKLTNYKYPLLGKEIELWCKQHPNAYEARCIERDYMSDGKFLGKHILYNVVEGPHGDINVYRNTKLSPRTNAQ